MEDANPILAAGPQAAEQSGNSMYSALCSVFLPSSLPDGFLDGESDQGAADFLRKELSEFLPLFAEFKFVENSWRFTLPVGKSDISEEPQLSNEFSHIIPFVLEEHAALVFLMIERNSPDAALIVVPAMPSPATMFSGDMVEDIGSGARRTIIRAFFGKDSLSEIGKACYRRIWSLVTGGGRMQASAQTTKTGKVVHEPRNAPSHRLVFEFLEALCTSDGVLAEANEPVLKKKIRDIVSYKHKALPWRRSIYWLACKFGLELCFFRALCEVGVTRY
jgi:hypothetical protein